MKRETSNAERNAEKERKKQERLEDTKRVRGSLSVYMSWPVWVSIGILILCGVVTAIDWVAGGVASIIGIIIVFGLVALTVYYYQKVSHDMVSFGAGYAQIQKQLLHEMEVPYAVTDERGNLIWMNQAFKEVLGEEGKGYRNLNTLFPEIHQKYPKGAGAVVHEHCEYQDSLYEVTIKGATMRDIADSMIDVSDNTLVSPQMYAIYLKDETKELLYAQKLKDEKLVMALIYLDNYDEVLDSVEEVKKALLMALVDRQINKYTSNHHGVIRRLENDKYFAVFTQKDLLEMQKDNFSLLDEVKRIKIGEEIDVTISIGLGINGSNFAKTYEYARTAIDMALGRGGDQAVLKDGDNINYYGGKVENKGKTTRVKARVKAHALRELIEASDDVIIMGHRISDADCIGAAVGIYRAATYSQKKAYIVLNTISNNVKPLLERLQESGAYASDLFIDNETALSKIGQGTLVVVVDTNTSRLLECPQLLERAKDIVVIDHHRESKDALDKNYDLVLKYVESYVSSASEMVAELLQYYADDVDVKAADAEAMYAGIMIDTNNFLNKTNVRTFEAAAFLRRKGLDVTRVRKLFRDNMGDYKAKAEAVRNAQVFMGCYAISVCPANLASDPTVMAAQAANELLGIRNIKASFVLTDYDNQINISARSIDEINVQIVMEKLGGGGHLSSAGAQLRDVTTEEAIERLKEVLKENHKLLQAPK